MHGNAIYGAFARSVRRNPRARALHFAGRDWSYAELAQQAFAAATLMSDAGVNPGDRVAFLGRNSDAYAVGWLATQLLEAVHVPINFMLTPPEIAYILDHADPKVLFVSDEFAGNGSAAAASLKQALRIVPIGELTAASCGSATQREPRADENPRLAQIAYTSGTESAPKGAMLTDIGLVYQYMSCIEAGSFKGTDVVVHALPLYHCAQLHCFLTPHLMLGSDNIVVERPDPAVVIETVARFGANSYFSPPTVWISILNHQAFDGAKLARLDKGYYGASIMPSEVLRELQRKLPALQLHNMYGQTEIGPLATTLRPHEHATRPSSVGRPVLFVDTRLVDDDMEDVAPGTVGEIVHRSPQLMTGYYRDPAKTAEAFEGGWFHSGDLAVADDEGYLQIVDRKKDMIKSGGENVSSREVEERLYVHPAVAEVAVVGVPDEKWVEAVCAVVVRHGGQDCDEATLIQWCGTLAPFKRPKHIVFVPELPKNPSGKILKRELRRRLSGVETLAELAGSAPPG
jgi:fatty-acyl-CoA synthase